jgi:hypothetical protein
MTASVRTKVADCPACTWTQFAATAELDPAFVKEYRAAIDEGGTELIRRPLIEAWRRRGYRVDLLTWAGCIATSSLPDDPPDAVYDAVHQEAADAITADALVHEADLVDQLAAWRRAHPHES